MLFEEITKKIRLRNFLIDTGQICGKKWMIEKGFSGDLHLKE